MTPRERRSQHPSASEWSQVWNAYPFDREPTGNIPIPDVVLPRDDRPGMVEITARDGPDVVRLHTEVWGEAAGGQLEARWTWLTQENPHRSSGEMIGAAWQEGGELRAYQLMLPQVFRVDGRPWRVYQVGSLTASEGSRAAMMRMWRKSRWWPISCWGVSSYAFPLLQRFYRHEDFWAYPGAEFPVEDFGPEEADASLPCFLSWRNPPSMVRPVDFSGRFPVPGLAAMATRLLRVMDRRILRRDMGVPLREVDRFPGIRAQEFDALMDGYPFLVERSVAYLNWRYVDRPGVACRRFLLDGSSGEIKAWAVIDPKDDARGLPCWEICDCLAGYGDLDSYRALLVQIVRIAREAGISTVRIAAPTSPGHRRVCRGLGFITRPADDRRLFLWRVPSGISPAAASDLANWYLVSGDVDPTII